MTPRANKPRLTIKEHNNKWKVSVIVWGKMNNNISKKLNNKELQGCTN